VSPKEKLLDQSLAETRCLLAFLREALSFVPESPGNLCLSELYGGARRFVEQFARQACERDALAANALSVALEEVEQLQRTGASLERAAQRLREMVVSLRIGTSGPKPGHVHVSHYGTGGYSGRPHLFVLGLDERRFPGIGIQEPVLLDHERMAINRGFGKHLSLAEDRPTANLVRLTACLAAHRGPMVLSYSCRDLLDNREVCPSSVILQAHRLITGRHDDDYSALDKALPPPHGFVVTEGLRLTESERWIAQIKAVKGGTDARSAVDKAFPWLKTGALAEAKRASAEFTEFDGYIPAACDGLDFRRNGKAVSPSALEDLAKCPFGYFLKRVLGVEPPEELERTPDVWLDPLQFGSLLHAVFEGFMRQLTELAEKPEFRKHRKALGTIAERKIHEFLQLYPSPGEAAFARTRRDIELALDTFLSSQERFCQDSVPCHFEVPFGLEEADTAKEPLATVDPVSLPVGKDKLAVRGIIDRIDRTTPHEYQVWDYKTGSASKYSRSKGLDSGRVLQFALYARVAERLLRQRDPDAKVTESGYLFPGPRGEGERIAHPRSSLSELEEVLGHILDMLRNGVMAHPPTGVCDYCDYQSVCGEPETAIERMAAKMDAAGEESPLKPYRSLYGSKTTKTGQK
jgi:ATP-dependent helicase/nuclease subunit B